MRFRLRLEKAGKILYEGVHQISDADSFGQACADVWAAVQAARLEGSANIGELMERASDEVIDDMAGAQLTIVRL